MASQLFCEHPKIILNPRLGELLAKYHNYVLFGQQGFYKYTYKSMFRLNKKPFYDVIVNVTAENIDEHVVFNELTGETYNIYLQVPCNECVLCKSRRQNLFVQRCRLECQMYDSYPWFVTLTYNDNNLPLDGVSVRDCQLFIKRFRINLERSGHFHRWRYVLVSEYGKTTHRAHYHMLIFGLNPTLMCDYKKIISILESSWSLGFVQSRIVNPADDKTFYYTSKYLRKDCVVPVGCNPTFILSSRRNGGIGAPFLDTIKDKVNKTLDINFKFLDKWSGRLIPLRFDGYVLNKIFPSYCKLIPSDLRVSAQKFKYYFECFRQSDPSLTFLFEQTNEWINNFLAGNIFLPVCHSTDISVRDLSQDSRLFGLLSECSRKIGKFRNSLFFFSEAQERQKKRDLFISKLFRYAKPIDLASAGYSARLRFSRAYALEQF